MLDLEKAKIANIEYIENLFNDIVIENPTILRNYLESINQNIKNLFMYEVDMLIKPITYDELSILIKDYCDALIMDIRNCNETTPNSILINLNNKIKASIEHPDFIFSLYKHVMLSNGIDFSDVYLEEQKKIIQTIYLLKQEND